MAATRRRVAAVAGAGAALLGVSLATEPGSRRFYGLTTGVAGTWIAGALALGPIRLGGSGPPVLRVLRPVAVGAAAFGVFYAGALVARQVPVLRRALTGVLSYAHHGRGPLVLATVVVNGVAEEVFFRGALYDAVAPRHPVALSTAAYALVTCATRNPALVLAGVVMGALFARQRQTTGGIQAPVLTHVTWSTLMVWLLPPLFHDDTT
jgi:membrane protease YdiL (CAAX protease family)